MHLTIRFAWHDNKWNGKVCENPKENIYIVLITILCFRLEFKEEEMYKSKRISEKRTFVNYGVKRNTSHLVIGV